MLEMFMFAVGVYYTPGPVNIIGFGAGLNDSYRSMSRFAAGVGCALLIWYTVIGILGHMIVIQSIVPYLALLGGSYIFYLAVRIIASQIRLGIPSQRRDLWRFRDGLLLQILNPKGMIVVVSITSIFFPAQSFGAMKIVLFSLILSIIGAFAPICYAVFGYVSQKKLVTPVKRQAVILKYINIAMGALLIFVGMTLFYKYVPSLYGMR
jgi:threonine/homoserine/homoserine lactone efflux protein